MDRDTFHATIIAFKRRVPSQPFTIALVNGTRLEVDDPDALAIRGGFAVFAGPGNIPVFLDHKSVSHVIGEVADRPVVV